MKHYLAFFHFAAHGKFDVTFPQFPGCVSQGDNFGDAQRMAAEALAFHVEGMLEDGDTVPEPFETQHELMAVYRTEDGPCIPVAIPLLPASGKSTRIQITIDSRLLSRIDAVTTNRSGFLADAAAARLGD